MINNSAVINYKLFSSKNQKNGIHVYQLKHFTISPYESAHIYANVALKLTIHIYVLYALVYVDTNNEHFLVIVARGQPREHSILIFVTKK